MSNKKNKGSQVIIKTQTTKEWEMCENKYIPAKNIILVYQDDNEQPLIKISDGVHLLRDLPFINKTVIANKESSLSPKIQDDILEF